MRTGRARCLLAVLGVAMAGAQFREGAVERIQDALRKRGLLQGEVKRGDLDVPTTVALTKLQRERDLARTGLPDRATLEALGIKPGDVFQEREIPPEQEQQRPAVLRQLPEKQRR